MQRMSDIPSSHGARVVDGKVYSDSIKAFTSVKVEAQNIVDCSPLTDMVWV